MKTSYRTKNHYYYILEFLHSLSKFKVSLQAQSMHINVHYNIQKKEIYFRRKDVSSIENSDKIWTY